MFTWKIPMPEDSFARGLILRQSRTTLLQVPGVVVASSQDDQVTWDMCSRRKCLRSQSAPLPQKNAALEQCYPELLISLRPQGCPQHGLSSSWSPLPSLHRRTVEAKAELAYHCVRMQISRGYQQTYCLMPLALNFCVSNGLNLELKSRGMPLIQL